MITEYTNKHTTNAMGTRLQVYAGTNYDWAVGRLDNLTNLQGMRGAGIVLGKHSNRWTNPQLSAGGETPQFTRAQGTRVRGDE